MYDLYTFFFFPFLADCIVLCSRSTSTRLTDSVNKTRINHSKMMRSVFKLPRKLVGQMAFGVLSRNMSTEKPVQRMEDYFKGKKFVVTGSNAGQ